MKQTLQLKLSQHLTLTPQLQQSIRLLQLSTLELNQELEKFLADNPLLEREEGDDDNTVPLAALTGNTTPTEEPAAETRTESEPAYDEPRGGDTDWNFDGGGGGGMRDDDDADYPQLPALSPTLRDHLLQQLLLTKLPAA